MTRWVAAKHRRDPKTDGEHIVRLTLKAHDTFASFKEELVLSAIHLKYA